MNVEKLLNDYKSGNISLEQATSALKKLPYEDIGCCKIDHHRRLRSGYPEVIFGLGKSPEQVEHIVAAMLKGTDEDILITRVSDEQYELIKNVPDLVYHRDCGVVHISRNKITMSREYVAVISGGTGDIPVCREAVCTLNAMGIANKEIYDVGVSGIHRLLINQEELQGARVIIAAAGMEGALPTVVAGITSCPVIAIPTDVGYGANFGGIAPLLTMLNSCANRVSVVNINNGYGAACVAAAIVGENK